MLNKNILTNLSVRALKFIKNYKITDLQYGAAITVWTFFIKLIYIFIKHYQNKINIVKLNHNIREAINASHSY